jgi:predicted nuclease with RNAse H fold
LHAVIEMVEAGGDAKSLTARLNELAAQRRELEKRIPKTGADVVAFHPKAAEMYADTVRQIHAALGSRENSNREAIELVREPVERIDETPHTPHKDRPTATLVVAGARSHLYRTPIKLRARP